MASLSWQTPQNCGNQRPSRYSRLDDACVSPFVGSTVVAIPELIKAIELTRCFLKITIALSITVSLTGNFRIAY